MSKDPNKGLLVMAFSMLSPEGPMYEALVSALDQFVENTAEIEDDDDFEEHDELKAARAMLDILNGRHAALAEKS